MSSRSTGWPAIALLLAACAVAPAVADVRADSGGVAIGGSVKDSTIIVGYSAAQLLELVDAEKRKATAPLQAQIDELGKRLGVTDEAVRTFLRILGEKDIAPEKLADKLAEIAQRHNETLQRLAVLDPNDPAIKALIEQARAAVKTGDYDAADRWLAEAETADLAAARQADQLAEQASAAAEQRYLAAAATRAERGEVALNRIDYLAAAEHFRQAANLVPAQHTDERANYLHRRALALYQQGNEFGDNGALLSAIAGWRELFALRPRERVPLAWATTQNNLSAALQTLGAREPGTARLEEAVAAFRAALGERTPERVPLDWAMTQNNLGNALQALGERESGTARLEEAVAAYRAALGERTRERVPLDWAATQNNLGAALQTLGAREPGTARLEEAVAAFRAALEVRTRERVPLAWAVTQNNLGNALRVLGERESGTARLEEAVVAYRAALDVFRAAGAGHYVEIAERNLARAEALLQARRR